MQMMGAASFNPQQWTGAIGDIGSWFSSNSQTVDQNVAGASSGHIKRTGTEKITEETQIDTAGIMKYVNDLLKDPSMGLANVVGRDKMAGLYGSSNAAFATNDLLDKIAGTIAQLTAKKVTTKDIDTLDQSQSLMNQGTDTKTKKPGFLASAIKGIGGLFKSDARLKSNIQQIGTTPGGFPWYRFEMDGMVQEGVMAQDLLILKPDAVHVGSDGYYLVDYNQVH